MVSEFRKKKLMAGFDFMDTDKSGTIDKSDFELSASKVAKLRGWSESDPQYANYRADMDKIWAGIQSKGDKDGDGKVTSDEWLTMWDEYSKTKSSPDDWQNVYAKMFFNIIDAGHDGKVDLDEYVNVLSAFGRSTKEEITEAFKKLAGGKPSITFEDFLVLWKEFFSSEDPKAPGNYIFGRERS